MSVFTDAERAYLRDVHPLARLATVGGDGTPHVMPIGMYRLDDATEAIEAKLAIRTATIPRTRTVPKTASMVV